MTTAQSSESPVTGPTFEASTPPGLMHAIIDSAMDAIVALDAEQRIVLFNPAAEAMFRFPAAQAIGGTLDRFLPPSLIQAHRDRITDFAASGESSRRMRDLPTLVGIRADGEEFQLEATIARVTIDDRTLFAAIIRDSSIRHQAEEDLRRQAEMLDLAYDAIFTWDWTGRIVSWNRGAEQLYGHTRNEAVGSNCQELLRTSHPAGFAAVLAALHRDGIWEGELRHVRRDGTEVIVASRLALVDGDKGQFVLVLEVAEDVSARKIAEAGRAASLRREATARAEATAANEARDRLAAILNALPGGVLLTSAAEGEAEIANSAMHELAFTSHHTGSPLAYGRDFKFLQFDGVPLPPDQQPIARALHGERVRNLQLILQRGDESRLPVEVFAAPLGMHNGAPSGAMIYVHDISRLLRAEQFKDDFLALVSHELRTPLTAIQGGARLLANKPDLDSVARAELLHDVVAESQRLDRLLGNLLALTQILAGRLSVSTEPVLAAPLAQRVAAEFADRNPAHTFSIDAGSELAVAEADPNLLEETLRNLYENAIKYSPHGGAVRTAVSAAGDTVVIRVSDEGIGFDSEHVATIFERFRRIGGDRTVRGMGLGLYLSQALTTAQGGRIEASSPGIGRGATITLTLPAAHDGSLDLNDSDQAPGTATPSG